MSKNLILEVAKFNPSKRGNFISPEELEEIENKGSEIPFYRSVYLYKQEDTVKMKNTVKDFFGYRNIDVIPIDIDKKDNTDKHTLKKLQYLLYKLSEEGLSQENFRIYFSGTGYHVNIHKDCFYFKPGTELPFKVKETMKEIFENDIDTSIYSRTGLYRIVNTMNQKSKLYKIPLRWKEVFSLTPNKIKELATKPRLDFKYQKFYGNKEFADKKITKIPSIKTFKRVREPTKVVSCVQRMIKEGAVEGSRNNKVLRIASHFRRHGIPSISTKAALLDWNNDSLEPDKVIEKVERVYNSNYKYGCNDNIMRKYCDPKCIYYKRKDYLIEVMNANDLQKELTKRMETNWEGQTIDLGRTLDLSADKEFLVYPGELVTIFGPTGVNKTSLAQNIVLGLEMGRNEINPSLQIPVLYLSLELAGWMVHRRNLQIVAGQRKETISKHYKHYFNKHKKELKHILVQTVSPTIKQIKDKIQHLQPQCVVVDYITQIETRHKDEYHQIREISHKLRNIATNLDIIIIQISQVSRAYSREQVLDLYAGKGSGGIENASSKVIGINGKQDGTERTVEMYKNTDGDLFRKKLFFTPSFRLLP